MKREGKIFRLFVFLILGLVLFSSTCDAVIGKSKIKLKGISSKDFQQFGFSGNGTVSITPSIIDNSNSRTYFLMCNNADYSSLLNGLETSASQTGVCNEAEISALCYYSSNFTKDIQFTVDQRDYYHFIILNCYQLSSVVEVKYEILDLGYRQLSYGSTYLPTIYVGLVSIWIIMMAIWIYFWHKFRSIRIPIHSLIFFVVIIKSCVVIVNLSYWKTCEQTGRCYQQLIYLQSFLFAISETAFFCAMLLAAKGWRITRSSLPSSEVRTIFVALILLLSTLLFFSFYNDGYYFLSLMIMYFFMLPKIFTSITRNTRALETRLSLLVQVGINSTEASSVATKIKLFRSLRTTVVVYLASILLVNSLKIAMVWYLHWIDYLLNESVILGVLIFVSWIFYPRHHLFDLINLGDGSLVNLLNMEQLRDPSVLVGLLTNQENFNMSNVMVIEYPHDALSDDNNQVNNRPLALALAEDQLDNNEQAEVKVKQSNVSSTSENRANTVSVLIE